MASAIDVGFTSEKWPPESEAKPGPNLVVSGTIAGLTRRLECRRSNVQKGFLASKKTLDLNAKYTELTIKVEDAKVYAELKRTCSGFAGLIPEGGGVQRFFPRPGIVLVWAASTIVADLAVDASVPDPLMVEGDRVKLVLLPGTLLCKQVELEAAVKRAPRMSIMGETHMFGVVQGGAVQVDSKGGMTDRIFAAKQTMKQDEDVARPSSDVREEEWD